MADLPDRYEDPDFPARREGFIGLQVVGKDPELWAKLRPVFFAKITRLIEDLGEADPSRHWLREQAKEVAGLGLDMVKDRLKRPGLENEQIEAQVIKLFAEAEKAQADARKVNAEAKAIEIQNSIKELWFTLECTKAMVLVGKTGDEAILVGQEIEAMIMALKAVAGH